MKTARRTGDTGRTYVAVDRVTKIMAEHDYRIDWNKICQETDTVIYYRDPLAEVGDLGHRPVWEVHFTRLAADRGWRFAMAFKRMSSHIHDDVVVRQVSKLAEAVKDPR